MAENGHWTNERHVHFLNSMEASFVQSMFQSDDNTHFLPPLDRHLPDTSESTHDLRKQITKEHVVESSGRKKEKRSRKLSCQKPSQDQVVPQFQNKGESR